MKNDTHQDEGQECKQGRPDSRVHRKQGEVLQHVDRTLSQHSYIQMCVLCNMVYAYAGNIVEVRSRRSKTVKRTEIKISITAAIERFERERACSSDAEVVGSEHKIYTYREEFVTEYTGLNTMCSGSKS